MIEVAGRGLLSEKCNDGFHYPKCYEFTCECLCHKEESKKKIVREPKSDKTIAEVYGTIDV